MKCSGGKWFFFLGGLCLTAALLYGAGNLVIDRRCSQAADEVLEQYHVARKERIELSEEEPAETVEEAVVPFLPQTQEMDTITVDGREYIGTLVIPSLELELPVLSSWDYEGLDIAPCRYEGSVLDGSLILAAHNYSGHFGRLNTMSPGDALFFYDVNGKQYSYEVLEFVELASNAREELLSGDWDLTLFTCTVGGRSRFAVRCGIAQADPEESDIEK